MKPIATLEDFLSCDSAGLANTVLETCPHCGRKHPVPFRHIQVGSGVVQQIPALIEQLLGRKPTRPVVIYDSVIEEIICSSVVAPLRSAGLPVETHAMHAEPGHLLDSALENGNAAADAIGPSADFLIGAGSGVISDTTKWIATRLGVPFLVCGTAPSMNGYTSITATITQNKIKISEFLNPADAVLMEVDIVKDAPMPMIHAGIGDLAARAICNADWKLSNLLRGTYFCPLPYQMTAENERKYLAAAPAIARRDPEAMAVLSEAILLSGLSMTVLEGETSPSSGAEHVLSHFWDFLTHIRGAEKNFHGAQVGVGTILMLNAYAQLKEIDPRKLDPQAILRRRLSLEQIEADHRELYGDKAESFNAVARKKRIADAELVGYLQRILDGWDNMLNELEPYIAPVEKIRVPFEQAGVPYSLASIHRTPEQAREALVRGSFYRPRYTLLDLFWELGLFPEIADEILERSGVL